MPPRTGISFPASHASCRRGRRASSCPQRSTSPCHHAQHTHRPQAPCPLRPTARSIARFAISRGLAVPPSALRRHNRRKTIGPADSEWRQPTRTAHAARLFSREIDGIALGASAPAALAADMLGLRPAALHDLPRLAAAHQAQCGGTLAHEILGRTLRVLQPVDRGMRVRARQSPERSRPGAAAQATLHALARLLPPHVLGRNTSRMRPNLLRAQIARHCTSRRACRQRSRSQRVRRR